MKGVVFNILNEMIEEKLGLEAWDTLLQATGEDGLYVATESYHDDRLLSLLGATSEHTNIDVDSLVFSFGEYMLPYFAAHYPRFFENQFSLKTFLLTVDDVIHGEVRKLFPNANLPSFEYEELGDQHLTMLYSSPRKLCRLAEGLISGSAKHFHQEYTLDHQSCMHQGHARCRLELTFHDQN